MYSTEHNDRALLLIFHWTLTLFSLVIYSLQLPAEHEGGVPARPRRRPGVGRRHHQRPDHLAV